MTIDGVKVNCSSTSQQKKIIDAVNQFKLDKRKVYCVGQFGELATDEKCTVNCPGCSCDCGDGYPCGHGSAGCDWCGHTGKSVTHFPDPVRVNDGYHQIKVARCDRCKKRMKHFDAGCKACQKVLGWND